MKLVIVSVFDRAAQAYGRPVFTHTKGLAVRSFRDEVTRADKDNEMYKHAEDYDLYMIGTFDDQTGRFEFGGEGPELILRGKDCHVSQ